MKLTEVKRDLFELEDTHNLVHCISADFALGMGIAKEFVKRYQMRRYLEAWVAQTPVSLTEYSIIRNVYPCIYVNRVFNLVTKDRYWEKPTYDSLRKSLVSMKNMIRNEAKIAMPKIGCGLDRLEWSRVREIIEEVFEDTDIEIVVCYL